MIITKLYKYDSSQENNGYRGEDFSKYILQGGGDIDNLDDTLDTAEITLVGLPFREEFAPSTKFILEKWQEQIGADGNPVLNMWKDFHLVVSTDAVEQPILSDNSYFNHSLSLIEPSVEAQSRLVDNIAVTYRLKDVTLESKPTYDVNAKAIKNINSVNPIPPQNYGVSEGFIWDKYTIGHHFVWVMPNWYQVEINGVTKTPSWEDWDNFKLNQETPADGSIKTIQLPIPMLECRHAIAGGKTLEKSGYCSIDVIVQRTPIAGGKTQTIQEFRVDPANDTPQEAQWVKDTILVNNTHASGWGEIVSRYEANGASASDPMNHYTDYFCKVAEKVSTRQNRVLTIDLEGGYQYNVIIKRHIFNNVGVFYEDYPAYYSRGEWTLRYYVIFSLGEAKNTVEFVNDNYPIVSLTFNSVLEGTNQSLYLRNAPTENALNLYNKAQLTTQNVMKISGTPVDETPTSFYLADEDKQQLRNTTIVENFYNQKNLWEIQMDIGKFIHARPKTRFGSNGRFLTTWKKYGLTNQKEDYATPISVFNSRFIEEYISACSSYVSNMVQLGGEITEIVAPKSSSEDYLVYNNVAEIIVEKNIIELVNLDVIRKSDGETRNLVGKGTHGESSNGFVFEENVYNLLSINANDSVNKGLAIYYKLGTNKIVGLNYQLPSINAGSADTDYAIKRIIGTVFGMDKESWQNIKINDYLFKISYRTKDTLRSNQARPDLRKYLLSTPFDRIPLHNQFNNQQDVVVDSVKFGNNIYGKLIRTGNKIYTKIEWVDDLFSLKQSGELYSIDGELYYVAKVKNTYFLDHIISEIEFSKDFNRLSQIIGIPSEPRFYEISEQSLIQREVALDDFIVLGTSTKDKTGSQTFIKGNGWEYIGSLLCGNKQEYPKYAVTIFKNDIDKSTIAGNETFKVETCHPVCCYSIENTLSIEWDMKDNFSAGDQVGETTLSTDPNNAVDTAYNTLKPYRYADVYGRCDMIDFAIMFDHTFTNNEEILDLPSNPINIENEQENLLFGNNEPSDYGKNDRGIILLKDNREKISINYNLQLLTDSDRFVLSAYMWQTEKQNLYLALLKEEVNKISNETIPNSSFAVEMIPFSYETQIENNKQYGIKIKIEEALTNFAQQQGKTVDELLEGIKAIALYSTAEINEYVNSGAKYFVFARNIYGIDIEKENPAFADWYISSYDKSIFNKQ